MVLKLATDVQLGNFFGAKPHAWAQVVSGRAAFRVFPKIFDVALLPDDQFTKVQKQNLIIQSFRSVLGVWAFQFCSQADDQFKNVNFSKIEMPKGKITDTAFADTQLIALSVSMAATAITAASFTRLGTDISMWAGEAGFAAAEAAAFPSKKKVNLRYHQNSLRMWEAVNSDCEWLTDTKDPQKLSRQPLWLQLSTFPEFQFDLLPDWARASLELFSENDELELGPDRQLIVVWYKYLLSGNFYTEAAKLFGQNGVLKLVAEPNEFWTVTGDRSADKILNEIAQILETHKSDDIRVPHVGNAVASSEFEEDISSALENIQLQTPAAYRFGWRDGQIAALPPTDASSDPEGAQIYLDEVRRKGQVLSGRLEGSNADPRVKTSVQGLMEVLTDRVEDLRPQLVRSRARSIEADALAYGNAKDRELELFPDAVAALVDLSESLRDLQGCYPQLRDLEAELAALDLDPERLEDARDNLDRIVDAAQSDIELTDPSAQEALQTVRDIAAEDAPRAVQQKRIGEYALVVRNFLSQVARAVLDNVFTREAQRLGSEAYKQARPKLIDNLAGLIGNSPTLGVSGYVYAVWGPVAGVATAILGFGKIDILIKLAVKWMEKKVNSSDRSEEQEDGAKGSKPPIEGSFSDGPGSSL